jgi:hypothetical protein
MASARPIDADGDADTRAEIPRGAPTRTLEKGLFLLGLFDVGHPEWSLKELRERAGLPKATTRRLMKTLEAANWVAYDSEAGSTTSVRAPSAPSIWPCRTQSSSARRIHFSSE